MEDELKQLQAVSESPISQETAERFGAYIDQGGDLIKQGKFQEAIDYFKNKEELSKIGWRLDLGSGRSKYLVRTPNPNEYTDLAHELAGQCTSNKGRIVLSKFILSEGVIVPSELQKEIALVYMEEWLHALQEIKGESLAGQENIELDVAKYMRDQGIELSEAFLFRYDRKAKLEVVDPGNE